MPKAKKQNTKKRMVIVFMFAMALMLYAVGYLINWQLVRGQEMSMRVTNQSLVSTTLTPERGTIYDSTGKVLAQSASVWTVALEPLLIKEEDKAIIASELSKILDLEETYVLDKTNESNYFTYIKRKIEDDIKNEVLAFMDEYDISTGIRLVSDYKRYYPYETVASSVIGFTGTDNNGLAGIELQYEDELSGTEGQMVTLRNAAGGEMPVQYEQLVEEQDGYDLVLTIDETIQSICEKYLLEGIEENGAKNGATAIVMDVNTGAIKALATGDQFDLNDPFTLANEEVVQEINLLPEDEQNEAYNTALYQQWRNKAVSDTYYPGSVFKMVTASALLDSGTVTENTTYICTGSHVPSTGVDPIACWVGSPGHGEVTVREGITYSCNPYFMQASAHMGAGTFFDYFDAFGFTSTTGIDLPGEAGSIYYEAEELGPVELATESFGQNFSVTPIQMITAVAAVANGGYVVQPHVVDKIIDSDGTVVQSADTEYKRQVISEETAAKVGEYLEENVTDGSGTTGAVIGYEIAGKTGTSEKIDKWNQDRTQDLEYIASYAGFAPVDDPQYALLVFFDETESPASGGRQAGPVFSGIMSEILPYLEVSQEFGDVEYDQYVKDTPNVMGMTISEAKSAISNAGLTWEVYGGSGDSDIVNMQIPFSGSIIPEGGKVIISNQSIVSDNHMVEVPDFTGESVDSCRYIANNAGLQIIISGSSGSGDLRAQYQSISAGELVRPGSVITVSVSDYSNME